MTEVREPLRHPRPFPWARGFRIAARAVIATPIAVFVFLAVSSYYASRHRFIVRNRSGAVVADVRLLVGYGAKVAMDERIERIPAGETVEFRAWAPDSRAVLTFTIGGEERRHEDGYIDLWAGEGWVFDVSADGSVVADSSYVRGVR